MNRHFQQLLVFILCFLVLISCVTPRDATMATPPPVQPTQTVVSTVAQSTQTIVSSVTQPTPTKTIFESQEQVSDGKLKLSIKKSGNQCYESGVPIPITLTYENLTNETITIVDYKAVSVHVLYGGKGQLFPVITENTGKEVLTPEHYLRVEIVNTTSPLLQDLLPKSSFDVSVEYYFPLEIVEIDKQEQKRPTPPGIYFLKFVYVGFENNVAWEGAISSNQVEICITD